MKRFFNRVMKKSRDPRDSPIIIVAFGDSVTQGAFEHGVLRPDSVYHRLLQVKMETFFPQATFSVINAGVGGSTAAQSLDRLDRDVIQYAPDLVLIAFGLNDAAEGADKLEEFRVSLEKMVSRVQKATSADIMLVTPPFMARQKNSRIHPAEIHCTEVICVTQNEGLLDAAVEVIREAGVRCGVPVADVHHRWKNMSLCGVDTDMLLANGLNHPDQAGHQLAMFTIWDMLIEEGASPLPSR